MATSEVELSAGRRVTEAFIDANPSSIVLIPRVYVKDGGGARWVDQPPRAAQTFRLIDQTGGTGQTITLLSGSDGVQRRLAFQLLGRFDAEIGLYDYWVDGDGVRCEVAELLPDNGYERRAQVIRYGQS